MRLPEGGYVRDEISSEFRRHGYVVRWFEVNAKDYGVPQHRERVLFVATRSDLEVEPTIPSPQFGESGDMFERRLPCRTFADACSDLPFIEAGESSENPFHVAVRHPKHVIEWLWDVPEGASAHDNEDERLRPPSGYNTTYKRQVWNEPGATVQTTFGMISGCRNVHPIATRSLTVREAARLQTFPDTFRFVGSLQTVRTGIGNAVPPLLAYELGQYIRTAFLDLVEVPRL
jgi:DNA (cytosine-5)-methyltransferase 1